MGLGGLCSTWTVVGGLRMHARVSPGPLPPGPPVVLVHGLGVSSRYMIPTARRLAGDHPVYAPDLPGSGRSERPAQVLDIDGLAEALAGWMRANSLRDATLIGNSLGCQTIAALTLRYPDLVARVALIGPTMDGRARTTLRQFWRLLVDSTREGLTGPYRTWRTLQYGLGDPLEAKLPRIGVPALVIRGSRDPIATREWCAEVARLLPRGRLVTIPGGAHTVNYSSPDRLVRVLRPFLRAASASGR